MPQLLIDTTADSIAELRLIAQFILDLAKLKDAPALASAVEVSMDTDETSARAVFEDAQIVLQDDAEIDPRIAFAPKVPEGTSRPLASGALSADTAEEMVATTATGAPTSPTDKTGRPWDERIDSGAKVLTGEGLWKKRKNLAYGYYEKILGEIQAAASAVDASPLMQTTVNAVDALPRMQTTVNAAEASPIVPMPPAPPLVPPPPTESVSLDASNTGQPTRVSPPPAGSITTFKELMLRVTNLMRAGRLTVTRTNEIVKKTVGLSTIQEIFAQPAHIPAVAAAINAAVEL